MSISPSSMCCQLFDGALPKGKGWTKGRATCSRGPPPPGDTCPTHFAKYFRVHLLGGSDDGERSSFVGMGCLTSFFLFFLVRGSLASLLSSWPLNRSTACPARPCEKSVFLVRGSMAVEAWGRKDVSQNFERQQQPRARFVVSLA